VKIYVAAEEGGARSRVVEPDKTIYFCGKLSFIMYFLPPPPPRPPTHTVMCLFCKVFKKKTHPMYDQTQGSGAMFYMLYE